MKLKNSYLLVFSDLHLHSKYSRAVSQQMDIPNMFLWEIKKGIGLLATGDWTHPMWIREIKNNLQENGSGILSLKPEIKKVLSLPKEYLEPKFLLSTEISLIYTDKGKGRRIHLLVFAPDLETVEKINNEFLKRHLNLASDGRPIFNLTARNFTELILSINPNCLVIPAHIWTPWFAVFGSISGYNSLKDCFEDLEPQIFGIETGLSSDPTMNWRVKELDSKAILSFSDAHSGQKLGREATVFNLHELTFQALSEAVKGKNNQNRVAYTIEFYPEEGKYHFTGHRACGVSQSPEQTKKEGVICPRCHRPLTVGVMHRVEELAGRSEKELKLEVFGQKVKGVKTNFFSRPPFVKIVPLAEIIAESLGVSTTSKKVEEIYNLAVSAENGEFNVLMQADLQRLAQINNLMAENIGKMRTQDLTIIPGYDGQFGIVKIGQHVDLEIPKIQPKEKATPENQPGLF